MTQKEPASSMFNDTASVVVHSPHSSAHSSSSNYVRIISGQKVSLFHPTSSLVLLPRIIAFQSRCGHVHQEGDENDEKKLLELLPSALKH